MVSPLIIGATFVYQMRARSRQHVRRELVIGEQTGASGSTSTANVRKASIA
jgi:hypothetical protein